MLDVCVTGQFPFRSLAPNYGPFFAEGNSPGEVCAATSVALGPAPLVSVTEHQCVLEGYPPIAIAPVCRVVDYSPFSMPAADGVLLSGLILSVWVSAAVFRWLVRTVYDRGDNDY